MATLQDKAKAQKVKVNTYASRVRRSRFIYAAVTFLALVVTPTVGGAWYFTTLAVNQYATEFKFAVRGRQSSGGADTLGVLLGAGSALASSSDSYIVVDYMESLEMLSQLQERVDLRETYVRPDQDFLHRYNGSAAIEDFRDYWEFVIDTEFDLSRGIVTVTIWSFSPEDSLLIAQEVLSLTRELVNQLSADARQEALAYANEQLVVVAEDLRDTRLAIQEFRTRENVIDPTADVVRIDKQMGMLESTIIELRTELDTQIATKGEGSASAQQLRERIEAANRQLATVEDSIDEDLPELAREYESLQTDQEISRETYAAALRARHEAEAIATQRQVYLSVYDTPRLAETSLYPDRPFVIFIIGLVCFAIWGIFYVVSLNIRDAAM